jgi:hypothetical protein
MSTSKKPNCFQQSPQESAYRKALEAARKLHAESFGVDGVIFLAEHLDAVRNSLEILLEIHNTKIETVH